MIALVAYVATLVVFAAVDLVWLGYVAHSYYRAQIGHLLAPEFNIIAVVVFYLVYVAGIVIFAILPALASGGPGRALLLGGLLGFFCYATYDLTNLATLKGWSLPMSLVDIAWGALLTGISASIGTYVAGRFE